ncbi:MAG: hypothetical protein HPY45_03955 [Anaerolineae bacterium]|nr:hypothetical protein [Anaerolineae bacterium]
MKLWQHIALGYMLGFLSAGVVYLISNTPKASPLVLLPPPTPKPVLVHVAGEVNQPGVYSLPPESRVLSAVEAAGGFTSDADRNSVNLAARLSDGSMIFIQNTNQPATRQPQQAKTSAQALQNSQININTASQYELESLPGIGASKALAIIRYRQDHGGFKSIEEIKNVPGIGQSMFDLIKDRITVNPIP